MLTLSILYLIPLSHTKIMEIYYQINHIMLLLKYTFLHSLDLLIHKFHFFDIVICDNLTKDAYNYILLENYSSAI